jgi:hypothetical protein
MARRKEALRREVEARQARIRSLLSEQGLSVAQVCKEVDITPKRVYVVAERWNCPTNPKIWPGSEDESSIARLFACGWDPERIGKIFKHAPASILRIMERVKESPILDASAKRFGVEAGSDHPRRQPGAKASANAGRRKRSR